MKGVADVTTIIGDAQFVRNRLQNAMKGRPLAARNRVGQAQPDGGCGAARRVPCKAAEHAKLRARKKKAAGNAQRSDILPPR